MYPSGTGACPRRSIYSMFTSPLQPNKITTNTLLKGFDEGIGILKLH